MSFVPPPQQQFHPPPNTTDKQGYYTVPGWTDGQQGSTEIRQVQQQQSSQQYPQQVQGSYGHPSQQFDGMANQQGVPQQAAFQAPSPPPGGQFFPQNDMFNNSAMLQSVAVGAASQFSSRFVKGSLHKYEQFATLKYYFAVSTSYVRSKLLVLAFPFRHPQWRRAVAHGSGPDGTDVYHTPADDVNGPDLYIPVMAFLTYILIVSFVMGEPYSFSPDVVAAQAWTSTLALFFEVLFVRLGAYLFASGSLSMLDLTCYAGYKYAHITVVTITGFIFGRLPFYATFAYSSLVACLFALKTYRQALPNNAQGRMRQYFILAVSAVQVLIMWLLVHSPAEVGTGATNTIGTVDYDSV